MTNKGDQWRCKMAVVTLLGFMVSTQAADLEHGEVLFNKSCTGCHGIDLFSSEKAKITEIESLRKRVNMCQLNFRAQWFNEDIDDVTAFLAPHYRNLKGAVEPKLSP